MDFSFLKNAVTGLAGQVKDLKTSIEKLKRQREDIANAPANLNDIKAGLAAALEERRAAYLQALRLQLDFFTRKPDSVTDPEIFKRLLLVAAPEHLGITPAFKNLENGIAGLFQPELLASLNAAVDSMDWPQAGLPAAQRVKKLAELDKSIESAEKQIQELKSSASAAGITIDV